MESLQCLWRRLQKNSDIKEIAYHCAMKRRLLQGVVLFLSGITVTALGAEFSSSVSPTEGWKLTSGSKDVAIYSRPHAGSRLKEFRAVGLIDAPTWAVHAVIDDLENYPHFMPYTLECQLLKRESDSIITYQRLSPKICGDPAYILRFCKKSWPGPGGFTYFYQCKPSNASGPDKKKVEDLLKICYVG